jgi:hypothetical protein
MRRPGLKTASDSSDEEEEFKSKIVTKDRYLGGVKLEAEARSRAHGRHRWTCGWCATDREISD